MSILNLLFDSIPSFMLSSENNLVVREELALPPLIAPCPDVFMFAPVVAGVVAL
jgi:hypothetical protein